MERFRVAQWGTGNTGLLALRALIERPDAEVSGVRVYDPAKVGQDAGQIAGLTAIGVQATDSRDRIIATAPDIALYMASVERHIETSLDDIAALLAAGIDVICTGSPLIDAHATRPEWGERLEAACAAGASSFLGLGLFPGFWGEAVVPVLSRLAMNCGEITIRESLDYSGYASPEIIFDVMGYGRSPADFSAPHPGQPRRVNPFVSTARIVAKALGVEIRSVEPYRIGAPSAVELEVAAGTIAAGTVGAVKSGLRADCGDVTIVAEHVTWMSPEVKPEWAEAEGYVIEFSGTPSLRCHMTLGIRGESHTEMGCLATAMHAIHAIPAVLAARPGVLDLADLPLFTGNVAVAGTAHQ